jgi:hypothetical protein
MSWRASPIARVCDLSKICSTALRSSSSSPNWIVSVCLVFTFSPSLPPTHSFLLSFFYSRLSNHSNLHLFPGLYLQPFTHPFLFFLPPILISICSLDGTFTPSLPPPTHLILAPLFYFLLPKHSDLRLYPGLHTPPPSLPPLTHPIQSPLSFFLPSNYSNLHPFLPS